MKRLLTLITLLSIVSAAKAQLRPFGNIDTADLKSTSCDFEKDAHAEVLFGSKYLDFLEFFKNIALIRNEQIVLMKS
ncbi:MAG: hypothetical protein JSU01_17355 [Bacteroidetes bacterium]|nr:hypothetical protein [Bacteroidota bacterium]